jgi:hypothetical protein
VLGGGGPAADRGLEPVAVLDVVDGDDVLGDAALVEEQADQRLLRGDELQVAGERLLEQVVGVGAGDLDEAGAGEVDLGGRAADRLVLGGEVAVVPDHVGGADPGDVGAGEQVL